MTDRRDALADDLRALADDFKSLLETATTDPKERQRKERLWRLVYSGIGIVATMAARRAAAKAWAILTGEVPPTQRPAHPPAREAPATPTAGAETQEHVPQQA